MTNSPEQRLIEALESIVQGTVNGFATPAIYTISTDAIQIARFLLDEIAELREKAEALEWLDRYLSYFNLQNEMKYLMRWSNKFDDYPSVFRQMISQKDRTND